MLIIVTSSCLWPPSCSVFFKWYLLFLEGYSNYCSPSPSTILYILFTLLLLLPSFNKIQHVRIFFARPKKELKCCVNRWNVTQRATVTSCLWGVGEEETGRLGVFYNKVYFWNHNKFTLLWGQQVYGHSLLVKACQQYRLK